jgi:hypothetical protein
MMAGVATICICVGSRRDVDSGWEAVLTLESMGGRLVLKGANGNRV